MSYKIYIGFLLFALIGCGSKLNMGNNEKEITTRDILKKITFLYFEVSLSDKGEERISLVKSQNVDGSLKANTVVNLPKTEGRYYIQLTDITGRILTERVIENPLQPVLERYDIEGNDTHQLQLNKGQFNIRFNYHPEIAVVKIHKIQQNNPVLLFKQNLTLNL